ncbi:MAG: alpha/beta fold hydrolase [Bermanella sp.]
MKSSSSLFPVSLLRADLVAERFIEDTYLLKPNNSADNSVQIAVTRLGFQGSEDKAARGIPVVLLHGSFSNRSFWFSGGGKGFAKSLLEAGFDPWMVEARGHGDSPVNDHYRDNNVETYSRFDLPAVQDFILEQTQQNAFWIGHSLGGVTIATALAGGHLQAANVQGIVLFGAQVSRYPVLLNMPGVRLMAKLALLAKKRIYGKGMGPEHEPVGIAREFIRWSGLLGGWRSQKGGSYWLGLQELNIPALGFGAKQDKAYPAKHCKKLIHAFSRQSQFYLLAKESGFTQDYNHLNMVVSKPAEQEVWPKAIQWMNLTFNP